MVFECQAWKGTDTRLRLAELLDEESAEFPNVRYFNENVEIDLNNRPLERPGHDETKSDDVDDDLRMLIGKTSLWG